MYRVDFKENDNESLELLTLSLDSRQRAEEQIIVDTIPYSDTEAVEHTGKYLPYERNAEFHVLDKTKISLINNWLKGYGRLRTFLDPGGYFKAHVINKLDYIRHAQTQDKISVTFKINPPFFYLESGELPITLTAPGTIVNPGTLESEPYIKITGTGNIDLDINGEIISLTGVDEYIIIDSESEYCYKGLTNVGDKMVGEFPKLKVGANNISWTGTVTKIEIIPRWREL